MRWTSEQRAFAVKTYFSNNHSYVAVQRAFRTHFRIKPRGLVPDQKSIVLWVENFSTTGSVVKKSSGRQRTITMQENVEAVQQSILRSPRCSACKHAFALDISNRSMCRILHEHLHFHSYKMVVVQELSPHDLQNRIMVCETLLETLPPDALVFFSDEAHFHLSGYVNKQNMRYWSGNNPRDLHERPLHSDKVTVWCALSRVGIIGPYFFRYMDMIKNFFEPALEEMHLGNVWFQQDGATAHTARASMTLLRAKFPGWLISLRGDIPWAAHSPDRTPCDFLWGYLKAEVFEHHPTNLIQLKNVIWQEVAQILVRMLERAEGNFRKWLHQCTENGGHNLQDILFKTI
ncbi:hypothetical protein B7P43_G12994 [Cryptotermes secundus]|uniref:DUF4817 domain-containing protein n=1 Tax=Cryptotermes secundus TaxID=105785 RepID=A0A2J7RMD7_9NEOP|nr:hypothetical protein B7P43_G12994 [Cryptotermes secundus]